MRLATMRMPEGRTRAIVEGADGWMPVGAADVGELIAQPDWRDRAAREIAHPGHVLPLDAVELTRPVLAPAKIICCGLNYHDHIRETGRAVPLSPTLFAKFADTLTDPFAPIHVTGSDRIDWEAELAVVVGRQIRRGGIEEARRAILGYTVANDISMRDWQSRTLQWLQGKAWDRTTPIGPVVVTADEISPEDGLSITAEIDGEQVQHSNTRELVFDAATLVAYVSGFTTLRPGDILLTGTPGGVGLGRDPQRWLRDGELLTTRIEGIGELRNVVRTDAEADAA